MKILVTGATGFVGRNVVDRLVRAGTEVRALTRNPAAAGLPPQVEVVRGDLAEPGSVAPAFDGIDRMYLFPVDETAREVVAMAERAGVRRVVDLSAASVTAGLHTNPVEEAVEESGMEWTHVRPCGFMVNTLQIWAPSVRAERVVRYPFADEPTMLVHEADIAAVAVAALLQDGHHGRAYTVTGPGLVSVREQVAAIGAALGEEVRYEEVTRERARELMRAQGGFAAESADLMLGFAEYGGDAPEGGGYAEQDWSTLMRVWPDVEQVTGRPPRTYAEWARDHAAGFR
ncbi:SDR family oxidoreductase [Planomonospora parontospora]|uniref:SDR family oxidoreductase n=1 Tax=Planomonospora parontospora TaxID=58119 RepID=UPI001670BBF3|nr:NAD(P)H-binding protein [Planomonospora parontospora]GGL14498.1 nucleotide-diphosphate-sugar epimerase [Planomonospora parontospora subsp. antibiotica]GII17823.1 nucleotide-diphosphate-sugar epimerase [Planomonospora parontospora subsp. antibiotica]